ncbi:MAG: hypothetical protein NTY19_04145 [Planctomycetota bacterium]|nr:hypothetical protein [Planctomycetota bacterium]
MAVKSAAAPPVGSNNATSNKDRIINSPIESNRILRSARILSGEPSPDFKKRTKLLSVLEELSQDLAPHFVFGLLSPLVSLPKLLHLQSRIQPVKQSGEQPASIQAKERKGKLSIGVDLEELSMVTDHERAGWRVLPSRTEMFGFSKLDNELYLTNLLLGEPVLGTSLEEGVFAPRNPQRFVSNFSDYPRALLFDNGAEFKHKTLRPLAQVVLPTNQHIALALVVAVFVELAAVKLKFNPKFLA